MGKYRLTFGCGHAGEVSLFGKMKERESRLAYLERYGQCPECRTAEYKAQGPMFWVRDVQSGVEVICWANSFEIKDELAARGFTFKDDLRGPDDTGLLSSGRKGWQRVFARENAEDRRDFSVIGAWVKEKGWKVTLTRFSARSVVDAIAEGRPDLLPNFTASSSDAPAPDNDLKQH